MIIAPYAKTILAVMLSLSIAGCEVRRVNETMDRASENAATAVEMAESLRQNKAGNNPEKTVEFSDDQYVSLSPLKPSEGLPLGSDCDITFNKDMSLQAFANTITKSCDFKVQITSDVYETPATAKSVSGPSPAPIMTPVPLGGAQPSLSGIFPSGQGGYSPSTGSGSSSKYFLSGIKYEGKLSGLLDLATNQVGLSWRYDAEEQAISIFYLDTKTFSLYAFADVTNMEALVSSGTTTASGTSGGGSSGGGGDSGGVTGSSGSSQTTAVTLKTSITGDIEKALKAMLSPVGKMAMASSTGTVTVTDRPDALKRIGKYLDGENKKLTQQILLNVKVFSVNLTDQDSAGIDWNLVYKAANGTFNLSNAFSGIDTSAVTGNVGVLDGSYTGTTAIVKALSQQGKVSVVTSPSVTTLNLQPVPVQVARQTGYVASISTTQMADAGATTSITPGTVTSGFNMDLLPSVLPNKELLLKYSINISSLIRIRSVSGGGDDSNKIEVPELDNRIFSQKVRLKSGSTLILSGFDQTSETGNKSGVGAAWNMMMGGGATRTSTRDVIVVLITPVIQE